MCQCTLFDVGGVEIHSIECIEYCTKDQSNVEDVEDRSNTPKGCNAMYVGDVEDRSNTPKGCNAMYVEDVDERNNSYYFSRANQQKAGTKIYSFTQCNLTVNECDWHILAGNDERINSHCLTRDRSNTPKGCNAMYVEDVEDGKRTYTHILAHNFLNT